MKKALSFAVALGLVAGMASSAVASDMLDFHGTSRLRAQRTDASQGAVNGKIQDYDMRTRFVMNAKVTDGVTVNTRATVMNATLGNGAAATGSALVMDYAYIGVNDLLGGNYSFGRMPASWTKFLTWGGHADRIKAMYKVGDGQLGVFIQKTSEQSQTDAKGDADAYSVLYVGGAGDLKYKAIVVAAKNDLTKMDDTTFDVNLTGKAGAISYEAELAYKTGDTTDAAFDGAQMGIMANGSMALSDTMTLVGVFAYADTNFAADDDFNPSNLIGNSVTAITTFGAHQASTFTDSDSAYIVAAGVGMKLDAASSVSFGAGYYAATDKGGFVAGDGVNIIEVDATYNRNLAKNTNFRVLAGYGMPDNMSAEDDAITSLGFELTTSW